MARGRGPARRWRGRSPSFRHQGAAGAEVAGDPGQYPLELLERLAEQQPSVREAVLADGRLVSAAPLLHDRDRTAQTPTRLEVTHEDDGIGEVARIELRAHRGAEEAALRGGEDREHVPSA